MEHYKIFVPSKGRVKNARFIQACISEGISPVVVVEKEDYLAYVTAYPTATVIQLPLSNKGITYVRNFIKTYASNTGLSHYWMIDDDVTYIYKRNGTKLDRLPLIELQDIGHIFTQLNNAGICALEYRQFAWSATKDYVTDSFCDSIVFINTDLTHGIYYDREVEGKEDRDFAMQCIKRGLHTYRSTLYAFNAPPNGSNTGGLKEIFYDINGREAMCAQAMVKKWGEQV